MFAVGDYVVYGTNGICQVKNITKLDLTNCNNERDYYVLESLRKKGNQSFVPVDSDKIILRKVIAKTEAQELIDEIPMLDGLAQLDDKSREACFKDMVKQCECRQWARILLTIYIRKKERLLQGKRMTATDERYMRLAKENLYEELGFVLGIDKEHMEERIVEKIQVNLNAI